MTQKTEFPEPIEHPIAKEESSKSPSTKKKGRS